MSRSEWGGMLFLYIFTAVALLGYWAFALHPEWLPQDPGALRFYSTSFGFFSRLHIVVAAVALGIPLIRRMRGAWIAGFVVVFGLSFLSEYVGTGYGIPFGGYGYTALLGAKLGGRVPALIPVSWFLMAAPSYVLARRLLKGTGLLVQITMASLLLVIWDLALDPAMSYLTPYWIWEETGPYYGMPWMNLVGWFATGLVLMAALHRFGGDRWLDGLTHRFSVLYYVGVLLMPLGMVVAAGEWLSAGVTMAALGIWYGGARMARQAAESTDPAQPGARHGGVPSPSMGMGD